MTDKPDVSPLASLRVVVVEDTFESRGLINSYLKQFGVVKLQSYANGSTLLKHNTPLEADVLLVGYGLGYCHNGIELVNALTAAGTLSPACKVLFITNSDLNAGAYLPCRLLKCQVLRKPINPRHLLKVLLDAQSSVQRLGDILQGINDNQLDALRIRLEQLPVGSLTTDQQDEVTATMMHLLLRLGLGNDAWQLASAIQEDEFRGMNKLALANALGDERKLTLTIKMSAANPLMRRRCLMYQIQLALVQRDVSKAYKLMASVPAKSYSLAEIELYALLLREHAGLDAALEYLQFKYRTSLENTFLHQNLLRIMVKVQLLECINDPALIKEMPELTEQLQTQLASAVWSRGEVDFSAFVHSASAALNAMLRPPAAQTDDTGVQPRGEDTVENTLLMALTAYLQGDKELARQRLLMADKGMLSMEISAEDLVNRWWFDKALQCIFAEPEQAREFNRIGLQHARENNPYPALRMFFRSYLCNRQHASIAINLLDTLQKLGIDNYWDVSSEALVAQIRSLTLRDKEADKLEKIVTRLQPSGQLASG